MRKAVILLLLPTIIMIFAGCGSSKNLQIKSSGFCCHAGVEFNGRCYEGLLCVDRSEISFEVDSPQIIKGLKITAGTDSLSVGFGSINKIFESVYIRDRSFLTDIYRCFTTLPESVTLSVKDGVALYSGNDGESGFDIRFTASGYPTSITACEGNLKISLSDHGPAE